MNHAPPEPEEGFLVRVQREAAQEAEHVLADLVRLRFRADQVARVLRALGLPYPDGLQALLTGGRLDGGPDLQTVPVPLPAGHRPPEAEEPEEEVDVPVTRKPATPEPEPAGTAPPQEAAPSAQAAPERREKAASPVAKPAAPKPKPPAGQRETYVTASGVERSKPTHPGAEALPEHLRRMPVASTPMALGTRIKTAELQLAVLQDVRAHDGALTPEIGERLGISGPRARDMVKALEVAGLVRRGATRLKHGVTAGKPGYEWHAVGVEDADRRAGGGEAPAAVPPPPAAESTRPAASSPAAPAEESASTTDVIKVARDWIVERGAEGPFTPLTFASAAGLSSAAGMQLLGLFEERGIVKDVSTPGDLRYVYDPPREPGRAAELDRQRAQERAREERAVSQNGSAPVAGTGRTQFSNHAVIQDLCERAVRAGALVEKAGSGHVIIRNAVTKARVILSSTPGQGNGSPDKARKRLAAIGITV